MGLQVSLCFNGNCREALEFYTKIFDLPKPEIMVYGDMPPSSDYPMGEEHKKLIMYTSIDILGVTVMLSDWPPETEFEYGKNIGLAIVIKDTEKIRSLYDALQVGGVIDMELQKTFWSDLFGMVTDKYGIQWQLNLDCANE